MNHSPLPVNRKVQRAVELLNKTYTFPEAMKKVIEGKKVSRLEWNDESVVIFLDGEYLSIQYGTKTPNKLYIRDGDLLGTDWIVVGVNLKELK